MPRRPDLRWLTIMTLAVWNLAGGFGFYVYILDCYVNYPPNHQRRQFRYHFYDCHINQEVMIGLTVVMVCQIISTVLLCFALDKTRKMFLLYGILISFPFALASLPAWPIAVIHVSIALVALNYFFSASFNQQEMLMV